MCEGAPWPLGGESDEERGPWPSCSSSKRAFSHSARTARAQRAHSANYYGEYPGNNPENHAPAESCTINSNLKNSNI